MLKPEMMDVSSHVENLITGAASQAGLVEAALDNVLNTDNLSDKDWNVIEGARQQVNRVYLSLQEAQGCFPLGATAPKGGKLRVV